MAKRMNTRRACLPWQMTSPGALASSSLAFRTIRCATQQLYRACWDCTDVAAMLNVAFGKQQANVLQVLETFDKFEDLDYARAGSQATEDFELAEGPLSGPNGPLPHTLEPTLRKYGLPTRLKKVGSLLWLLVAQGSCCNVEGIAVAAEGCFKLLCLSCRVWWSFVSDYVVCKSGDILTSNQAALLRVFDVKMAAFRMSPIGYWLAKGTFLLCVP